MHTLNNTDVSIAALRLLNGDNAILRNLTHSVSQQFTNLFIVVGRNSCYLLNLIVVVIYLLSVLLDKVYNSLHCLVNTTLQVHGVCTCSNVLQTYINNTLCKDSSSSCTITSIVTSL